VKGGSYFDDDASSQEELAAGLQAEGARNQHRKSSSRSQIGAGDSEGIEGIRVTRSITVAQDRGGLGRAQEEDGVGVEGGLGIENVMVGAGREEKWRG
jgi:hypothetical protein